MKIQSKFMTGLVSRIVKKVLRTKLGCEVDIQLNEFRTTVIDDKTHVHLDLDADLTKEELILALLGREQIAEALSQVALKEIIGVVLIYGLKALFENLSKNNSWPDKGNSTPPEDGAG